MKKNSKKPNSNRLFRTQPIRSLKSIGFLLLGFLLGARYPSKIYYQPTPLLSSDFLEARFSPRGGCRELIVDSINKAEKQIEVAIYCFSSKEIANALIAAHRRGVIVRIVADRSQRNVKNQQLAYLHKNKIPIRLARKVRIMHIKTLIIDEKYVLTGSYNFTNSAEEKNAEILLYIKKKKFTNQCKDNWLGLWENGKTFP